MKPAMYIFINEGLRMSAGKTAAQAAHAAVEAYRSTVERSRVQEDYFANPSYGKLLKEWYKGGHYMKLVMSARDTEHLLSIREYLKDRGFRSTLIIDEGHTEVPPISLTALGVELVDKDDPHTAATFESFDLLKSPRPQDPEERRRRLWKLLHSDPNDPKENCLTRAWDWIALRA